MIKKTLITALFIVLPFFNILIAQSSYDEIKDSIIDFEQFSSQDIIENIWTFTENEMDSADVEMLLTGSIFGTLLVKLANENKTTYKDLYEEFMKFKKAPDYERTRKAINVSKQLEVVKADYKNWETDKELFMKLDLSEIELERIRSLVELNTDPNKTYIELFSELEEEDRSIDRDTFDSLFEYHGVIDIEALLTKSVEQNKPILLYLTGFNCINCRKIEQSVLMENEIITSILNDFIFVSLYVDNRAELSEDDWFKSEFTHKIVKTVGQKNAEYEMSNFQVSTQPLFVCLNSSNEILGTADYFTKSVYDFKKFLEKCLK